MYQQFKNNNLYFFLATTKPQCKTLLQCYSTSKIFQYIKLLEDLSQTGSSSLSNRLFQIQYKFFLDILKPARKSSNSCMFPKMIHLDSKTQFQKKIENWKVVFCISTPIFCIFTHIFLLFCDVISILLRLKYVSLNEDKHEKAVQRSVFTQFVAQT